MPEQQEIDPQIIEQTRREIGRLISEIEALAIQELDPASFYAEVSKRVTQALASQATALWMRTPTGNLQLQFQVNLQAVGLAAEETRRLHDDLLRYALTQARPFVLMPYSGSTPGPSGIVANNPTGFLLLVAPIILDAVTVGLLQVFLDPARKASAQQGYMNFCGRVSSEISRYLRNKQFRQIRTEAERWNQVESFVRGVHGGLNPRQVSYLIANDGKKLIECERLSVSLKRGPSTQVLAISGQEMVEKRSNLVQKMAKLSELVLKHGENFIYLGKIEEHWPKDLTQALELYLEESNSKLLAAIPLPDQRDFGRRGLAKAVLIAEMIEDKQEPVDMGAKLDIVARHGASALYNALEHDRIPFVYALRNFGSVKEQLTSRFITKWTSIALLAAAVLTGIYFFPWPLRLEGRGQLVPEDRRFVYAPYEGRISEVKVDHNTDVSQNGVLAVMRSPKLELEKTKLDGEISSLRRKIKGLRDQLNGAEGDQEKVQRLGAEKLQAEQEVLAAERGLELVVKQLAELQITSPVTGKVMDWKPKERLESKPVQQGEQIFEIANIDGRWILEIDLPESVVSHITKAQVRSKEPLPVDFVLTSNPEQSYRGKLLEVSTQAQVVDQQNVVRAKIEIVDGEKPPLTKGVGVRAKVNCGMHFLGYVLLREPIDFVREYIMF